MKIALIHDGIICRGGAERVFLYFIQAFPEADIFSSVYYPEATFPEFRNYKIHTSWYNKITKNEFSYKKLFFPFGVWAAKSIDLKKYDVVLQSTTTGAKYAKYGKKTIVISYCHQPFRLLWYPNSYTQYKNAGKLKKIIFDLLRWYYKKIDYKSAQRVDIFIANSKSTISAIKKSYNRESDFLINPPIKENKYTGEAKDENYYLIVSRMEPYKKVDIAIEAFNQLNYKLIIVGSGTQKQYLQSIAKNNIIFKDGVNDEELEKLYTNCKALIFPQLEDYGITPLEANAAGRPVIAYGKGGVLETQIAYNGANIDESTALYFEKQDPDDIIDAVMKFEKIKFNKDFIIEHSKKFNNLSFVNQIQKVVIKSVESKSITFIDRK
ncbi:MAG TPA: glycosyltransferase [Bacteroidales bacterium]|nr:glycosyltransferase [Bacteroidales bacterium]HPS17665.1 glycosyltransferase [Bacteroidales bacterium]